MSHGDHVEVAPAGFTVTAKTPSVPVAAMEDPKRRLYCLQFHPEVTHSAQGTPLLLNVLKSCGMALDWNAGNFIEEKVQVKFVVAPDGTTLNPALAAPPKHKEFEPAAIQAVALMSYEPPLKDGKPVYVEATTTLNFTNERPDFGDGGFVSKNGGH